MTSSAYLSIRGYAIHKSELNANQIIDIKKELTITPYSSGPIRNITNFPIYRESAIKLYMPKYYGIKLFGEPIIPSTIPTGTPISVPFSGVLKDYQSDAVNTFIEHKHGLFEVGCGKGKTVCALNIVHRLAVKTLVIVHMEFLMDQWIKRAQQFLPTAKIGKIQGNIIDVDGKDIVIGMLQSISKRDYDTDIFKSFGLIIIDEVHHISAEVFSQALFKINARYMLGLSATMERKDKTSNVFKMFIGNVIYQNLEQSDQCVHIRAFRFKSNDEEFAKIEYDYRGNMMYSTMINKLCTYNRRSTFIVNIVLGILKEYGDRQQIMILAQNKNLLTYMHDAFIHNKITDIGYYIGGMKQSALDESSKRRIILATFSMASEALDIPTLSTLVLATPKSEVQQAVGRILRVRHCDPPLVIDIIDEHYVFKNQWTKRKKFYMSQNYLINNMNYVPDDFNKDDRDDSVIGAGCILAFDKV